MEYGLDLEGQLRPGLDVLATEIVLALKTRARYLQNLKIYRPGLVIGNPGDSLLMHELNQFERIHAELGKYTFASQQSFTDISDIELIIKRQPLESPIKTFHNDAGDEIIRRYLQWVEKYCEPGTEPEQYGETVTADVNILMLIFQRINLGMLVAESKYQADPEAFIATQYDENQLRGLIVNRDRETSVMNLATQLAEQYEFGPDQALEVFEWMISMTVDVQIKYLMARIE